MSDISASKLESLVAGDPDELGVHLKVIERDVALDEHNVKIHCHCLAVDANGRVQPQRLAEFMRKAIVDYAIPRSQIQKAKERDAKYNSTTEPSSQYN